MAGATAGNPTSLVELTISCRNLRDADVFSKSDPIAIVFHKPFGHSKWVEFQRTECIDNTLNPDFATKIKISYRFEEQQHLKICLYDIDSKSSNLNDHDYLGEFECTLGSLVSVGRIEKPLTDHGKQNANLGKIIVVSEELNSCREEMTIQFTGTNIKTFGWFCCTNVSPFLEFYKTNEDGTYVLVHRTEHIRNSTSPSWQPFKVPLRSFCSGDYDRSIKVNCKHFQSSGSHILIGSFLTNVRMLREGPSPSNTYDIVNEDKKRSQGASYTNDGQICITSVKFTEVFSFIDYLKGGTDLNAFIAIDFTASNGDPRTRESLHYMNSSHPNQYQRAIQAVGDIIEDYDSDKYFPVLGFGARLPPNFDVASHLFFVNGHDTSPFCYKVDGVLQAYQDCIARVQLYGPTNFAPIIRHVSEFAAAHKGGDKYFILLMITDGIITDMPMTKKEIVHAADLPLSIIIVGVGNADFDAMEELDGDVVRVSYNGKKASRDIVQFVPFRDFMFDGTGSAAVDTNKAKVMLAREVLAEVPDQFLSFMRANNVKPGTGNVATTPTFVPDME